MKKSLLQFLIIITAQFLSAQRAVFETGITVDKGSLELQNSSNQTALLYTDGEGDFVIAAPNIIEFQRSGNWIKHSGGDLQLNSGNNNVHFALNVHDDNYLNISKTDGSAALHYDGSKNALGINSANPNTDLEIRQGKNPSLNGFGALVTNLSGLTIEHDDLDNATLFIDSGNDLTFAFNGAYRSYIKDIDGKYFNAGNIGAGGAIQSHVRKSRNNYLEKIQTIWIGESMNKSTNSHELVVDGKQLQMLYPSIVDYKEGNYGIATSDFGLLAIKAIQEQQEIIESLLRRIEVLEH